GRLHTGYYVTHGAFVTEIRRDSVKVQNIGPDPVVKFETGAAFHTVVFPGVPHPCRDGLLVVRLMLRGNRHPGTETGQGLPCTLEGRHLGAFDIHLDEVHFGQPELGDDLVDGGQRDLYAWPRGLALQHDAVRREIVLVDMQGEDVVLVPHAFGVDDYA